MVKQEEIQFIEYIWKKNFIKSELVVAADGDLRFSREKATQLFLGQRFSANKIFVSNPFIADYNACDLRKYFDEENKKLSFFGYMESIKDLNLTEKIDGLISILECIGIKMTRERILDAISIEESTENKELIFFATVLKVTHNILQGFWNKHHRPIIDINNPFKDHVNGDLLTLSSMECGAFVGIRIHENDGYFRIGFELYKACEYPLAIKYLTKEIDSGSKYKNYSLNTRAYAYFYNYEYDKALADIIEKFKHYKGTEHYFYDINYIISIGYMKTGEFEKALEHSKNIEYEGDIENVKIDILIGQKKYIEALNLLNIRNNGDIDVTRYRRLGYRINGVEEIYKKKEMLLTRIWGDLGREDYFDLEDLVILYDEDGLFEEARSVYNFIEQNKTKLHDFSGLLYEYRGKLKNDDSEIA